MSAPDPLTVMLPLLLVVAEPANPTAPMSESLQTLAGTTGGITGGTTGGVGTIGTTGTTGGGTTTASVVMVAGAVAKDATVRLLATTS